VSSPRSFASVCVFALCFFAAPSGSSQAMNPPKTSGTHVHQGTGTTHHQGTGTTHHQGTGTHAQAQGHGSTMTKPTHPKTPSTTTLSPGRSTMPRSSGSRANHRNQYFRVQIRHPGTITHRTRSAAAAQTTASHLKRAGWHTRVHNHRGTHSVSANMTRWHTRAVVRNSAAANSIAHRLRAEGFQVRVIRY
jgi:hypothetical protein